MQEDHDRRENGHKECRPIKKNSIIARIQYIFCTMIFKNFVGIFINKKFCLNNQLPRIYGNIIVISLIWYGAYCDINYFSYYIKNPVDRKYECVWISLLFIYSILVYLSVSWSIPSQTKIEDYIYDKDSNYTKPLVKIDNSKFKAHCDFCKAKKHERVSHCKECNFCVLRRDHHCPAMGICVGLQNTQGFCNICFAMAVSRFNHIILSL